jgi:hypothetical protein
MIIMLQLCFICASKQRKLIAQHYKKAYRNIKTRAWRVLIWGGKITTFDKSYKNNFQKNTRFMLKDQHGKWYLHSPLIPKCDAMNLVVSRISIGNNVQHIQVDQIIRSPRTFVPCVRYNNTADIPRNKNNTYSKASKVNSTAL